MDSIETTFAWLEREIRAGHDAATTAVPMFGSDVWASLPDDQAAKWVALIQAARAWYADYVSIGDRVRREAREELERFEAYAQERDRAHYAPMRQAAREAAQGIERREREASAAIRTDLPNRTGPELIAAAYASWGLEPPAQSESDAGMTPEPVEVA